MLILQLEHALDSFKANAHKIHQLHGIKKAGQACLEMIS
jgi:hypothetical protein